MYLLRNCYVAQQGSVNCCIIYVVANSNKCSFNCGYLRKETGQKAKNPPKVSFDVVCARINEKAFTFFLLFF